MFKNNSELHLVSHLHAPLGISWGHCYWVQRWFTGLWILCVVCQREFLWDGIKLPACPRVHFSPLWSHAAHRGHRPTDS